MNNQHVLAHDALGGELQPADRTLRLPAMFLQMLEESSPVGVGGAADVAAYVSGMSSCEEKGGGG